MLTFSLDFLNQNSEQLLQWDKIPEAFAGSHRSHGCPGKCSRTEFDDEFGKPSLLASVGQSGSGTRLGSPGFTASRGGRYGREQCGGRVKERSACFLAKRTARAHRESLAGEKLLS